MSRFDNNCLWITGRFYDRISIPVFVHIIGCDTQMDHHPAVHVLLPDEPDGPAQFDVIELFHNSLFRLFDIDGYYPVTGSKGRNNFSQKTTCKKTRRRFLSFLQERKHTNKCFIIRYLYFCYSFFSEPTQIAEKTPSLDRGSGARR